MSESENILRVIAGGGGVMRRDLVDVMECIRGFDRGFSNIYLVDEGGKYTGKAVTRENFRSALTSAVLYFESIPYIANSVLGGGTVENYLAA